MALVHNRPEWSEWPKFPWSGIGPVKHPLSTVVLQNAGYNQTKHKLTQILPFPKLLDGFILIQCWRLLMMKEQFTYS